MEPNTSFNLEAWAEKLSIFNNTHPLKKEAIERIKGAYKEAWDLYAQGLITNHEAFNRFLDLARDDIAGKRAYNHYWLNKEIAAAFGFDYENYVSTSLSSAQFFATHCTRDEGVAWLNLFLKSLHFNEEENKRHEWFDKTGKEVGPKCFTGFLRDIELRVWLTPCVGDVLQVEAFGKAEEVKTPNPNYFEPYVVKMPWKRVIEFAREAQPGLQKTIFCDPEELRPENNRDGRASWKIDTDGESLAPFLAD